MEAKLLPCDEFAKLCESTETAGQNYASIAHLTHLELALVHVIGLYQVGHAGVMPTLSYHELGDYACGFASCSETTVGDGLHEPHVASSVDDVVAVPPDECSQLSGGSEIFLWYLVATGAVYGYVLAHMRKAALIWST